MTDDAVRLPPVDWAAAGRWAGRLAPSGPAPSRAAAVALVAGLRSAAERARPLALRASGLAGALDAAGNSDAAARVLVVDRPGWAVAAGASFASLSGQPGRQGSNPLVAGVTAQAAAVLALLSSKVLGQFDPYASGSQPYGRLILVAPNVLHSEQVLGVDPDDFRLWVCVHEQTHALQFAAAPWLAGHVRGEATALLREVAAIAPTKEVSAVLGGLARALRGSGTWSLLDVLPAAQRARVERLTAVMSLLEGHADVAMDAVGRRDIPSVRTLRSRLDARRGTTKGPADLLLRRLLGLDAKLAQYRNGAAFVRAVQATGDGALDAVWAGPESLPLPGEIADPRAWLRRVHGAA
jgi:coenzyme F420 biosynthesis associated uncharacterized protein